MKFLTIAAVGALTAAPAFAGDIAPAPVEPVVNQPAPIVAATGNDWTGGYAGVQLGYGDLSAEGAATDEGNGAIGGAHVGYNFDYGNYVLGTELELNGANIDLDSGAGSLDAVHRLKGRVGYDAGNTLFYGTAGLAYADAEVGGNSLSDTGWVAGAGVEYAVSDRMSVGGEVLYHQFDDLDNSGIDVDATTAQARVSFRF